MITLDIKDTKTGGGERLDSYIKAHENVLSQVVSGEEKYKDFLGWFHTSQWAGEDTLDRIQALADQIRADGDAFVLIGVGGSNNAARSVIEALKTEDSPQIIYGGNTLSPAALGQMMDKVQGKRIYIDCIAKNFETLEPGSSFRILRKYMYDTYGSQEAARRIIATGTRGSLLEQICREHGYTFLDFPEDVGGRFSALTNVGLLPMAVAGIDIRRLVKGAADMERELLQAPAIKNTAFRYACLRNMYLEQGYTLEMLASFEPAFRWFYKWWVQLFAETEGKDGKGLFPVTGEYSEELHAVGQFVQDGTPLMFETFLNVREATGSLIVENDGIKDAFDYLDGMDFQNINRTAFEATVKAHCQKLPCLILTIDTLDEYHFGQMFYFFLFACYLSAKMLGVNPFDQPGVEAYKNWMFEGLGKC
ncbi:glucose-6-phosphate isomerase [Catenibacillus scindens]|uniref:Glucose-6-phosphate isomerase n=1 Tax=Catenibacillus scindens TaxID=673271 RepID=A0A7W8HBU5_9FIRM|nr:glucose-6-phosphate isomerase [Catenibacillus scindens]